MNLKQQIQAFVSQHQTTGWIMLLMVGGLILQGILFVILAAVTGVSEACPPGPVGGDAPLYCRIVQQLVLPPGGKAFLFQPWSVITYPFFVARFEILRILFDGIIIWAFGRIHQQIMGDARTRRLSILTIPITAIITVIICSLFTPLQMGPPVYGVTVLMITLMVSAITLVPDFSIQLLLFGRVKIIWIGLVLLVLSLVSAGPTAEGVAVTIAAAVGFFHVYLLRKGTDLTEIIWSYYQDREPKPRMKVKYGGTKTNTEKGQGKRSSKKGHKVPQEVIDGILDKISAKGYDSLSREEKEILFTASSQSDDEKSY
ncbi:MAG: DUF6576 domain-containing protein [Bacteroidota bacterium]